MHFLALIEAAKLYCKACKQASKNPVEELCLRLQIEALEKVRSVDDISNLHQGTDTRTTRSCFLGTQAKLRVFLEHLDVALIGKIEVLRIISILEQAKADCIVYESKFSFEREVEGIWLYDGSSFNFFCTPDHKKALTLNKKYAATASAYKARADKEAFDVTMSAFVSLRGISEVIALKTVGAALNSYHRSRRSIKEEILESIEVVTKSD
jgi:hypothetical protein